MNTFTYIILALVAVCTVCTVIVMVKVFSSQETTSDVSSKDFDRLEGKILEENRSARQELSDNIDKIRKELSENVGLMRAETVDCIYVRRENGKVLKTSELNWFLRALLCLFAWRLALEGTWHDGRI